MLIISYYQKFLFYIYFVGDVYSLEQWDSVHTVVDSSGTAYILVTPCFGFAIFSPHRIYRVDLCATEL